MKIIGVIPARFASTRFEGKVLANIQGKPMIRHVWEKARKSKVLDDLIIACDDKRVLRAAQSWGARAVMTASYHPSGSDRIAEVVSNRPADIIVNIQGDEPLIHPKVIDALARALVADRAAVMATTIKVLNNPKDLKNPNVVKVVIDQKGHALYFSRSSIPFSRDLRGMKKIIYYKHLGLYAYRRDFLLKFTKIPKSYLEKVEKLEQLRALEAGYKIKTVLTKMDTIGVDTPEDLKKVKALLKDVNYG